ncbi:unnamed protein product [Cyprideis torosa]|uniref:Uncharacterized protein n=1 Tax=Cyprideis torosa TaxID=163714 RepID=A0A7R8ZQ99_9CRUS|nr:unnamed protein product [Cyprideis torosa]CAG0902434.1 unnamed protein product [Cyprideis torosa]
MKIQFSVKESPTLVLPRTLRLHTTKSNLEVECECESSWRTMADTGKLCNGISSIDSEEVPGECSVEAMDKKILQPYSYICDTPGKDFRPKLAQAFNFWLRIPEDKLKGIEEVVQMLHNASLLIDDIEDSSVLRRGLPVAHSIYGVPLTINAANLVYFLALEKVIKLNHPEATTIFAEQIIELHRGQGMEIYWRDSYICPTEEEYFEGVKRKTGGLFGLAIRLMQLFSVERHRSDFTNLINILGLYFQIRDDYVNLCSAEYAEKKSFCEDLTEGKFNYCIVHAIRSKPEDGQVLSILRQRTRDKEVKKYCVNLLEQFGSFAYTRKKLAELDKLASQEVERLGGNAYLTALLGELKLPDNSTCGYQ